jgi:hypothetical protein
MDFTAAHFAADVPSGGTMHADLAASQVSADPMHARQVSVEFHPQVGRITRHVEEFGQRLLPVALIDQRLFDLGLRLGRGRRGREALDLDRDRGLALVLQTQ